MAQFDYGRIAGIASDVLTQFHQGTPADPIILVKTTPGTGPAQNPGPEIEQNIVLTGATVRGVPTKYILRSLAIEGDLQVTMKIDDGEPKMGDKFLIHGQRYRIVQTMPTPPVGAPVVFKAIVRAG